MLKIETALPNAQLHTIIKLYIRKWGGKKKKKEKENLIFSLIDCKLIKKFNFRYKNDSLLYTIVHDHVILVEIDI